MKIDELKTVIMAGGRGTRISSLADNIPKPMIKVHDKPVLEHQLCCLKRQGIKEVTIVIGHLGEVIKEYFKAGQDFGLKIEYIIEETPLGTGGSLRYFAQTDKTILIINGDVVFDIDITRFLNYHSLKKADITLFTHPNDHPYDSALIKTDHTGRIVGWINKEDTREDYKNRVNAGIHLINPNVIDLSAETWNNIKVDLDRDFLKPNIDTYRIFAYDSPEYVKDMGTPERYYEVCADYISGKIEAKNLNHKQKAIFLDRDGTLNQYKGYITNPEDLKLIDHAAEAVRLINKSGYLAIVVTNQPVIARGECSLERMEEIHNRMERLFGEEGAYLDDIIFCPHHPDSGFDGERQEYKIICDCRKPKPGMIYKMSEKYNIDLNNSYMVGDDLRDIEAGQAAGCKSIYIGDNSELIKRADGSALNLLTAIKNILENKGSES